jgi:catechol 2,3-dioxygenase-like lactoylglutathione lyase family enzyme
MSRIQAAALLLASAVLLGGCASKAREQPVGLALACVVLSTPDPERLSAWYARVLGFRSRGPASGVGKVRLLVLERGADQLVLATLPGQEPLAEPRMPPRHLETPGLRNLVFWVEDLARADAHLEAQGVPLALKDVLVPDLGVRTTSFHDPDGNLVALWQRP